MFDNIRIILVETSHPGNIGAAARAMKTMGLSELVLVRPAQFPSPRALAMAAGADDILDNARVVSSLSEALTGTRLILGASARPRELALPGLVARQAGEKITEHVSNGDKVAILFGRENSGLTSEELRQCHYHVMIPSDADYGVLNLAQAVQVICYEIRMHVLDNPAFPDRSHHHSQDNIALADDVERFYIHMEKVLKQVGALNPKYPKRLVPRLKRLFQRAVLEEKEVRLLRGILSAIEKK